VQEDVQALAKVVAWASAETTALAIALAIAKVDSFKKDNASGYDNKAKQSSKALSIENIR
jgi:hypothetical protein